MGQQDGQHYYVMQFIEGRSLDQMLADGTGDGGEGPPPILAHGHSNGDSGKRSRTPGPGRDPWREVAGIGVQVAEALEYAHQHGTLHRDIKPGNLLMDSQGTVWVTDFGLAKITEGEDLTRPGDVFGTLRYMAPEQFDGRSDPRSDVYSLGLTLYELATGRPAFDQTSRHRLVRQVTEQAPPRRESSSGRSPGTWKRSS